MTTKEKQERTPFKEGEREKVIGRFLKTYFAEEDARRKLKDLTEQLNAIAERAEAGGNTVEDMQTLGVAARDQHQAEGKLRELVKNRKQQADAIRHNGWLNEEQLELGMKGHPDDVLDGDDGQDFAASDTFKPAKVDGTVGVKRRPRGSNGKQAET